MESIADNGFALCEKLGKMYVDAIVPPVINARTFENVDRSIPVFVPDESVDAYKSDTYWQEFNIKAKTSDGVENITTPAGDTQKLIINGQLIIVRDGKMYNAQGAVL